jgi:hypothetical protein
LSTLTSRSLLLAERRIDFAMIPTWDESAGSGRVTTAASKRGGHDLDHLECRVRKILHGFPGHRNALKR